jgi:hypothetical protein
MPNSYRIRTEPGINKDINIQIQQDFDFLEILSLKITQSEIYARQCSDYGVIVGRVIANNGYGVPNAKVSVFIPLTIEDETNPIISTLYPYKSLTDKNEDGYRYNLLPYSPSYSNHVPTGTFPDREDVLINKSLVEVYDKYYKFTVRTNDSGDFMIFGVPIGSQTLVMDLDLSDMGQFSLSPQDLIRMGMATADQVSGTKFKSDSNLDSLPQLINVNTEIEVLPFWGEPDLCQIAITRTDFDLVKEANLDIQPTSIFMGSIVSTLDKYAIKRWKSNNNFCKVKGRSGELCSMTTGPGEILAIRQTINLDLNGQPILEQTSLEQDGKVIDENGTWLIDLPLNLDYIYTNEFGQQVISNDPNVGIPTKAKYRFKIKWQQPNTIDDPVRRAYYLVPNIREYGWTTSTNDPLFSFGSTGYNQLQKSYAFSLDWADYADIPAAINCEDFFFEFDYNQVYTISQLIDQYRGGVAPRKIMSIKYINDDVCESTNNPFPANDAQYRPDFIYILFSLLIRILTPVFIAIMAVIHVLGFLLQLIAPILFVVTLIVGVIATVVLWIIDKVRRLFGGEKKDVPSLGDAVDRAKAVFDLPNKLKNLALPNLTYPDCEMCNCDVKSTDVQTGAQVLGDIADSYQTFNVSQLSDWNDSTFYDGLDPWLTEIENRWIPDPTNLRTGSVCSCTGGNLDMYLPTDFSTPIQSVLAGRAINTSKANTIQYNVDSFMPYYQDDSDPVANYTRRWFATNLTMAERLNLFNTKSKYFDSLPGSDSSNKGVNQIQVSFNYTGNTMSHLDNVLVLSCDPGASITMSAGTIVYFQNPNKSSDVNCFSADTNNQLGIPSITGSSVNTSPTINVNVTYANPSNPNASITVPYTILSNTADTQFHTFPIDVEYFQVITAMTISQYSTMVNPTADANSLWNRYLNNPIRLRMESSYGIIRPGVYREPYNGWNTCGYQVTPEFPDFPGYTPPLNGNYCSSDNTINGTPWETVNPLTASTQGYNQLLVFLVRGVDPYSTRNENSYNLAKLFGYDYTSLNAPIVTGKYKLNIPIQPTLKNAKHNQITSNSGVNSISSYSNTGIYYQNFNYQPSVNDFSAFTTTLHGYYSDLDSSSIGTYDAGNVFPAGASHIYHILNNSNSYSDPVYNDIRIQGPRPFQKHNSPTTLGSYWVGSTMTINSVNYSSVPCVVNEIVWPQRNPQISLNNFNSNIANNSYYKQDFNIFTCDYTVHKTLYGYESVIANRVFRSTSCTYNSPFINPDGNLVTQLDRMYTIEPDGCWTPKNDSLSQNKGYFNGESVEGGGLFGGKWYWNPNITLQANVTVSCNGLFDTTNIHNGSFKSAFNYEYFAPTYDITTIGLNITLNRNTVMRSDRLPTSTSVTRLQNNSYALHQNPSFLILTAPDSGVQANGAGDVSGVNAPIMDIPEPTVLTKSVTDSLNDCGKMVQLDCYKTLNNQIQITNFPSCNQFSLNGIFGLGGGTYATFDYGTGCYRLVQRFITGLPRDILLLLEWKSRLDLTFGACRNVFGHMFTNNWINGTLFAYSYKNDKFFDSNNKAYYLYCRDTLVSHDTTNNYYYRSSPWDGSDFIGKSSATSTLGSQRYNLNNPTTVINLGPRNDYLDELVFNDKFDGYVVDKLKETTFSDTSDILNIFILSRLANSNLFSKLIGAQGAGILGLFTREPWSINNLQKQKNIVDADFAQLISITSEIGVAPFEEDNGNPIYFNGGSSSGKDSIIGLYFSSDTQIRDYVSPRRTIYVDTDPQPYPNYDFNYIPVKTQMVPFYGWVTYGSNQTIFGTQQNDWNNHSNVSPFPKFYYQQLDRLDQVQISNYMASLSNNQSQYLKGHIYNVDTTGSIVDGGGIPIANPTVYPVSPSANASGERLISVGAPFHFYFGLIKGATAYDRFVTKWVKGEVV